MRRMYDFVSLITVHFIHYMCTVCKWWCRMNAVNNVETPNEENRTEKKTGDLMHVLHIYTRTLIHIVDTQSTVCQHTSYSLCTHSIYTPLTYVVCSIECLSAVSCKRETDWTHDRHLHTGNSVSGDVTFFFRKHPSRMPMHG